MKLIVTDRASIERGIVVRSSYVVLSIHDPDKPPPRIPSRVGMQDILTLSFHDAEPVERLALPKNVVLMTAEHANAIWEFVQLHREHVGAIVCHCEQGMSRSPAVAAALSEALGEDPARFLAEYQPNRYVYEMVLRAVRHNV